MRLQRGSRSAPRCEFRTTQKQHHLTLRGAGLPDKLFGSFQVCGVVFGWGGGYGQDKLCVYLLIVDAAPRGAVVRFLNVLKGTVRLLLHGARHTVSLQSSCLQQHLRKL